MPRNGSGVMSWPAGTDATPNTVIESSKYNAFLADLLNDLNTARPIVMGGTGATTAADARTNLGVTSAATPAFTGATADFTYTDDGAAVGPLVRLNRVSSSPAASDVIGQINFNGRDSAGNTETYAAILTTITDPTSTTEDAKLEIQTKVAGSLFTAMTFSNAGASISNALAASATPQLSLESTDAGATGGPWLELYRNSATPATSDIIGGIVWAGEDSAGNRQEYAYQTGFLTDVTNGSEDSYLFWWTCVAGTLAARMNVGAGLSMTGATGGDPGAGKFNATDVQVNGVSLQETGSWTPAITFGGGATGLTYGSRSGSYTRVGNVWFCAFNVVLSAKGSSTGNALLTGLPVSVGSATGGMKSSGNFTGLTGALSVDPQAASTTAQFKQSSATGSAQITDAAFTNTTQFSGLLVIRE